MPEITQANTSPPRHNVVHPSDIYFESLEFIPLQNRFGYGIRLVANDPDVSYQPIYYSTDTCRGQLDVDSILGEGRQAIASECNRLRRSGAQGTWIRNSITYTNLTAQRRLLDRNIREELAFRLISGCERGPSTNSLDAMTRAGRMLDLSRYANTGQLNFSAMSNAFATQLDMTPHMGNWGDSPTTRGDTIHVRVPPPPIRPCYRQVWVDEPWARTRNYRPAKRGMVHPLRHSLSCFNLGPTLNFKHRSEWIAGAEAKRALRNRKAPQEKPPKSELMASLKRLFRDETPHNTRSRA